MIRTTTGHTLYAGVDGERVDFPFSPNKINLIALVVALIENPLEKHVVNCYFNNNRLEEEKNSLNTHITTFFFFKGNQHYRPMHILATKCIQNLENDPFHVFQVYTLLRA